MWGRQNVTTRINKEKGGGGLESDARRYTQEHKHTHRLGNKDVKPLLDGNKDARGELCFCECCKKRLNKR